MFFNDGIYIITESEQELSKMLQVTNDFLTKWKLKVNQNKSGVIAVNDKNNVSKKEENLKINIDNKVLESKNSYKYLG